MAEAEKPPGEITVRTGPVRASGYAIKLRRVINAALREHYKTKALNPKKVNDYITTINKVLYQLLVDRLGVPKELVVDISGTIAISGDTVTLKDIEVALWDKDELLSRTITRELKERLAGIG